MAIYSEAQTNNTYTGPQERAYMEEQNRKAALNPPENDNYDTRKAKRDELRAKDKEQDKDDRNEAAIADSKKTGQPAPKPKYSGSWDNKSPELFDQNHTVAAGKPESTNNINRQALPFMFEVKEAASSPRKGAEAIWHMLLPSNPEGYRMVYSPRVATTFTQGGVYEDNIGLAPPKFVVNGVVGVLGTTVVGMGKSLDNERKTGLQLYHELEQGLLSFYERFGNRVDGKDHNGNDKITAGGEPELRFYNFCDQEYWKIQINQFTLTRNTQRRHLYQYEIQFTGLKRLGIADGIFTEKDLLKQMVSSRNVRDPSDAKKKVDAFDKFLQGVKEYTAKISNLINQVKKMQAMMNQIASTVAAFKNGLTALIHLPFDIIKSAREMVGSILKSIHDIGNLPHEFRNDMRDVQRLCMSYESRPEMFSTPTSSTSTTVTGQGEDTSAVKEVMTQPINLTADVADSFVTMQIPEDTIFATTDASVPVAAKMVEITDTDTIQSIAAKTGTDWQQIAILNNIEYPFIVMDAAEKMSEVLGYGYLEANVSATDNIIYLTNIYPEPGQMLLIAGSIIAEVESVQYGQTTLTNVVGADLLAGTVVSMHDRVLSVKSVGESIGIPGTTGNSYPVVTQGTFEERMYGIDEQVNYNGYQPDNGDGDIPSVRGMSNMEMQLSHRIRTMRGELASLGHPEYGSLVPMFVGKPNTPVWRQRILLECMMTAMDDPRVDRLTNIELFSQGISTYFGADVYLKGEGNPIQVSFPIA